ncbi:MAG: GNAT family N-acetyltransferase [Chloroflexi bacterium]|nr:GNAT family N-acetyltransferase [Chloroflexota bacterium]
MTSEVPSVDAVAGERYRAATPSDIDALVTMINAAYRKAESNVFPRTTRTERVGISNILPQITVAERDGRLAGCIHITTAAPDAHFGLLAVNVDLHGGGLGSRLIAHAELMAREAGCLRMCIEVVKEGIPGRVPFYERRGYRVVAEHSGQEWNGGADWGAAGDWHMVELEKPLT